MASPAQIAANQRNAAASTGPRTESGKSRSAANAITLGLFTLRNITQPGEEAEYATLTTALWSELAPQGAVEETLAAEILRAAWRLQRCASVEASLGDADSIEDPMANPLTAPTQSAVDRARVQNHRLLHRSMAELRRLQSERQFRIEVLPKEFNTEQLGLGSYVEIIGPMATDARLKRLNQQINGMDSIATAINATMGQMPAPTASAKRTQFAPPSTPRNAPCPCGSGQKFKRCCGQGAEPMLFKAA